MNMDSVNKWLTLVANLGVIAGIIFLAVEVGQNQQALEEQNLLTDLTGRDSAFSLMGGFRKLRMENPELDNIWRQGLENENLSSIENNQFELLCEERIFIASTLHNRFTALGDTVAAQNQANGIKVLKSSSVKFNECWQRISLVLIDSGSLAFLKEVNAKV